MASLPFFGLAAVCAITYLATPLKRGRTFVRKPFSGAANETNGPPLGFAQGYPSDSDQGQSRGPAAVPCAKPKGDQ